MSQEETRRGRSNEEDSIAVWQPLISALEEGIELTEDQKRALELRRVTLDFAGSIDQLIEDPSIKNDPSVEAEVTARYWQSIGRLKELGIAPNVHVGDDPDSFNNPTKLGEYVAGQMLTIEEKQLPNVKQVLYQVEEHSEGAIEVAANTNAYVMPTKNMSPSLKDWMVLRAMVNMAHLWLASDLDREVK